VRSRGDDWTTGARCTVSGKQLPHRIEVVLKSPEHPANVSRLECKVQLRVPRGDRVQIVIVDLKVTEIDANYVSSLGHRPHLSAVQPAALANCDTGGRA